MVRRLAAASCRRQPPRGLSLIEVLVAVVVLSIGLLGLAGLQASGMRVGQSSLYRSLAAQLASDMVDRMRANVSAASAGTYNLALFAAAPAGATVAERDLKDWRQRLASLPSGTGSVAVNGVEVTVVVQWDHTRGAGVLRAGSTAEQDETARLRASQFQITAQLAN